MYARHLDTIIGSITKSSLQISSGPADFLLLILVSSFAFYKQLLATLVFDSTIWTVLKYILKVFNQICLHHQNEKITGNCTQTTVISCLNLTLQNLKKYKVT